MRGYTVPAMFEGMLMTFNALLGALAMFAVLFVRPACAAQVPERAVSLGPSVSSLQITKAAITPELGALGAQSEFQIAQHRRGRRRATRNIIGGIAAGAVIGGIVGGRRGAGTGAVIGGVAGAVRAAQRPRYRRWRRGGSRRWRGRRRR